MSDDGVLDQPGAPAGAPGQDPEGSEEGQEPADVHRVYAGGREFVLVGTAHISRESVDLVVQ